MLIEIMTEDKQLPLIHVMQQENMPIQLDGILYGGI